MTPHEPRQQSEAGAELLQQGRASAKSTLLGCLGLCCVLLLPALLFLPAEGPGVPRWMSSLVPLCGVGIAAVGVWLVARVPASAPPRSSDPLAPLTGAGRSPVREVPARRSNRIAFASCVALAAGCGVGYLLATFVVRSRGVLPGTLLAAIAGGALAAYSILTTRRRVPTPAVRWVTLPVGGGVSSQPVPFLLVGAAAVAWSLIVAFEAGYAWAALGAGVAIVLASLLGAIGQHPPRDPDARPRFRSPADR